MDPLIWGRLPAPLLKKVLGGALHEAPHAITKLLLAMCCDSSHAVQMQYLGGWPAVLQTSAGRWGVSFHGEDHVLSDRAVPLPKTLLAVMWKCFEGKTVTLNSSDRTLEIANVDSARWCIIVSVAQLHRILKRFASESTGAATMLMDEFTIELVHMNLRDKIDVLREDSYDSVCQTLCKYMASVQAAKVVIVMSRRKLATWKQALRGSRT